jgi:hypothetical protein
MSEVRRFRQVMEGREADRQPVQLLRPEFGQLAWLVDAAASAGLRVGP